MAQLAHTLLLTGLAGLALPVGGLIARIERLRPDWLEQEFRHGVLAFGGGILLAAVALVLVPHGTRELETAAAVASFMAGASSFSCSTGGSSALAGRHPICWPRCSISGRRRSRSVR